MLVRVAFIIVIAAALAGCASGNGTLAPVTGFEPGSYMGRWYEIARFPRSFENGLDAVTADYTACDDGSIRVVNRGFDPKKGEWREVERKATFSGPRDVASLKVRTFGPFHTNYRVVEVDSKEYKWALVATSNQDYLRVLCREPEMDTETFERVARAAIVRGFDLSRLVRVDQSLNQKPSGP